MSSSKKITHLSEIEIREIVDKALGRTTTRAENQEKLKTSFHQLFQEPGRSKEQATLMAEVASRPRHSGRTI